MRDMQPDISDLAHHLRQEKLFIDSEKLHIQHLNEKVMKIIEKVYHASFMRGEQRRTYNDLVLRPHSSPPACCQRSNLLSQLQFIDGYHVLTQYEPLFGEFLLYLRLNPKLCAQCLVAGEISNQDSMQMAASTLFSSVYANCILPEDELFVLSLLKHLMKLQLANSEKPRHLLHHGSCAFSQIYRTYVDTLPQAKIFLTAALHQPIMHLLMEDELFLDIDPSKAATRFPPEERLRRFGKEGTKEYEEALAKYRAWTINKIVNITKRFIESIKQAMHCFPATLAWLVQTLYEALIHSKKIETREISMICIDLVFTFFLCSAVVTPEPHGIVDAPISHISRFNLIQVAQILQVLAMSRWEPVDPKLTDLYSHFDKEVIARLVNCIIDQEGCERPPVSLSDTNPLVGLSRTSCAIPESHLYSLINFLLKSIETEVEDSMSTKELELLLNRLKPRIQNVSSLTPHQANSSSNSHNVVNHVLPSPLASPKKNLLNRVKITAGRKSTKSIQNVETYPEVLEESTSSQGSSTSTSTQLSNSKIHSQSSDDSEVGSFDHVRNLEYENVLVIGLPSHCGRSEIPGMMSEEKVMLSVPVQTSKQICVKDEIGSSGVEGTIEKRTRFSLSHDEGSIGNTSDNLEAISEAASNHSVASSMDDVEQADPPDNLSDMVSANVSGRGTPNVSGRDTPSSQVTDGDESGRVGVEPPSRTANIPVTVIKPERADIEEKFGRFEIKPILAGDETFSLVSDTWSTDVLASDSETIDAADRENRGEELHEQLLDQHLEELDRMHGGPAEFLRGESAGETFETASEAWSTDVLASDSERLTEFDTDDAQSVARSDDTGRSEVEAEMVVGEPNNDDNKTPRAHGSPNDGERAVLFNGEMRRVKISDDVNFIPVMRVNNEDEQRSDFSRGFTPIHDDSITRPGASGTQSLGRLSLTLSDLPNNGIVPTDQPLLLNHFVADTNKEANLHPEFSEILKKQSVLSLGEGHQRKILSGGGSAEDGSIHLSTASLSSSSSGSEQSKEPSADASNLANDISAQIPPLTSTPTLSVSSTGAIPKSISFDKTAEKGDRESIEGDAKLKKGSFLKGFIRQMKTSSRRKVVSSISNRSEDLTSSRSSLGTDGGMRRSLSEDNRRPIFEESTDDILNKYRKKPTDVSEPDNQKSLNTNNTNCDNETAKVEDERLIIDSSNIESSYAFKDAKRKLRLVLSTADVCTSFNFLDFTSSPKDDPDENDIISWLKSQIAEAQNMQDRSLVAQLQETQRCIQLFDQQGRESLVLSLKEDYQSRSPYIAYLVQSRQGLLSSYAYLNKLLSRLSADANITMTSMVSVCVRMFLERRDGVLGTFTRNFTRLTVPDEKVDLVESFLAKLYAELERDPMWISSTPEQLTLTKKSLERAIMSHIYIHALYPNGDGDLSRDQVLSEHMKKLSAVITPDHEFLRIPKLHQYECPWPSAQAELKCLGAYKTSEDKVRCIVRAAKTIMNLLSMAHETSVPAADDFTPVLIYVLIKANPPWLLSTVQYVDLFYEQRLSGEDQYWWTQFKSAIEIIKNMDYSP